MYVYASKSVIYVSVLGGYVHKDIFKKQSFNKVSFTRQVDELSKEGSNAINLQYGNPQGATQSGMSFGGRRDIGGNSHSAENYYNPGYNSNYNNYNNNNYNNNNNNNNYNNNNYGNQSYDNADNYNGVNNYNNEPAAYDNYYNPSEGNYDQNNNANYNYNNYQPQNNYQQPQNNYQQQQPQHYDPNQPTPEYYGPESAF